METPTSVVEEYGRIVVIKKDGSEGSFCPINRELFFGRFLISPLSNDLNISIANFEF